MSASKMIRNVFKSRREELVISLIIILFLIVISASLMFHFEHHTQPDKFTSIRETMLWSVGTLTTVGFGNHVPITPIGKFLTAFISILGIGVFALPAGILAFGFSDEFKKLKKVKNCCPHCGEEL